MPYPYDSLPAGEEPQAGDGGSGHVLLPTVRTGILMRTGLIIAFALSYFLLVGLADGSESRLPDDPVALTATLAAIPVAPTTA